ncbi:MAG: TIGR00725 family protein [Candidatus Methanofastidiosia archaeon]
MQITVIGACENVSKPLYDLAYALGTKLASRRHIVICGGRGGIMEAVSKGVKDAGGIVVGILPDLIRNSGNKYLSIEIPTGINEMRNAIVVGSGDIIIAFPGSYGTISELAFSMRQGKKIIIFRHEEFPIDFSLLKYENIRYAQTIEDALLYMEESNDF